MHMCAHPDRPDRWLNPPEASASVPGVWGHLLTFLGGAHACIGYRFSITEYVSSCLASPTARRRPFPPVLFTLTRCPCPCRFRMKALVFTLIRNFEFELAVPANDVEPLGTFLQRPGLRSERKRGAQLPLLVRPVKQA